MRWPKFRTLVLLFALSAAPVSGACQSGEKTVTLTDGNAAAAASVKRTTETGTVRFELNYEADQAPPVSITGSGAFDFDANQGTMNVTVAGNATQVIVTKKTIYAKLPGVLGAGAKPWASFSLNGPTASAGGFDQIVKLADPREALLRLKLADGMSKVGTEKLRGVATTHFRGVVDLSDKSLAKLNEEDRAEAKTFRDQLGAPTHPIDLWLDGAGRVRRFEAALTGSSGDKPVTVKTHIDLFDFGSKVTVKVPPPNLVRDISSLTEDPTPTTTG